MNLYQIDNEFLELQSMLEESEGELTEELAEALKINEQNFNQKLTNYFKMYRNMDADCDKIDAEIKRLSALKSSKAKIAERLKEGMKNALTFRQMDKYDGGIFKLSFRKSESVEILDEEKIPKKFFVTKVEISKSLISAALKGGLKATWARIKENSNIQIK